MEGQPIKKKKKGRKEVKRDKVDFYTAISQLLSRDC